MRWFWWRINAWCEVVAMISSFAVSVLFLVMAKNGSPVSTHVALVTTVIVTTICWVATAWLGPETDRKVLIDFYRKVRPAGPGWAPIRAAAGALEAAPGDNIPLALLGWAAGCMTIWSALFTVGNILYGRLHTAGLLFGVFLVSGVVLVRVMGTLWSDREGAGAVKQRA
jgi:hypothetical protein